MGDPAVIVAFVTARLDEDVTSARAAAVYHGKRWHAGDTIDPSEGTVSIFDEDGANVLAMWVLPGDAAHIARHDPARVLREIEAKRAVLAWYADAVDASEVFREKLGTGTHMAVAAESYLNVIRGYAAAWSDHPDYQEGWKP